LAPQLVVCGADPVTGNSGFLLALTVSPPPAATQPRSAGEGWIVRLEDGTVCRFATGATGHVDGKRANYDCGGGRWILGDLMPGRRWSALLAKVRRGPNGLEAQDPSVVRVSAVWQ
jgi:hypothetical protein